MRRKLTVQKLHSQLKLFYTTLKKANNWSNPGTVTEFHPRYNNKQTNLLVFTLEGHTHESTIKLKIADVKNLQLLNESTTKLASRTGSAWGTESEVLNR